MPDWVTLDSTDQTELMSRAGNFLIRLKVKATSAAVIGVPLLNLTPCLIVNVRVLLPLLHAHLVASQGDALAFSSVSTKASGSYTCPRVMPIPRLPGLKGLKLQFHWVPATLMIVSVPVGPLPPAEPEAELDGPEELQAASAAASSAAAPAKSKRLMGGCPSLEVAWVGSQVSAVTFERHVGNTLFVI